MRNWCASGVRGWWDSFIKLQPSNNFDGCNFMKLCFGQVREDVSICLLTNIIGLPASMSIIHTQSLWKKHPLNSSIWVKSFHIQNLKMYISNFLPPPFAMLSNKHNSILNLYASSEVEKKEQIKNQLWEYNARPKARKLIRHVRMLWKMGKRLPLFSSILQWSFRRWLFFSSNLQRTPHSFHHHTPFPVEGWFPHHSFFQSGIFLWKPEIIGPFLIINHLSLKKLEIHFL